MTRYVMALSDHDAEIVAADMNLHTSFASAEEAESQIKAKGFVACNVYKVTITAERVKPKPRKKSGKGAK